MSSNIVCRWQRMWPLDTASAFANMARNVLPDPISRRSMAAQTVSVSMASHIFAGLRFGAALTNLDLVATELTRLSAGIGYRLEEERQYLQVDRMFVALIRFGLPGAALDAVFVLQTNASFTGKPPNR